MPGSPRVNIMDIWTKLPIDSSFVSSLDFSMQIRTEINHRVKKRSGAMARVISIVLSCLAIFRRHVLHAGYLS